MIKTIYALEFPLYKVIIIFRKDWVVIEKDFMFFSLFSIITIFYFLEVYCWINIKCFISGRRLAYNILGCWGLGIFLTSGICHIFITSQWSIWRVELNLLCRTKTDFIAKNNCKHPRQILYIRLKLLKMCCHKILIDYVLKYVRGRGWIIWLIRSPNIWCGGKDPSFPSSLDFKNKSISRYLYIIFSFSTFVSG